MLMSLLVLMMAYLSLRLLEILFLAAFIIIVLDFLVVIVIIFLQLTLSYFPIRACVNMLDLWLRRGGYGTIFYI